MSALTAVTRETFLRLRRDKIFLPAVIAGVSLLGLSGLASYWGVEEFFKILYDLGTAAFQLTGAAVAIVWGNKIISDSRQEGSVEVQLASPIGRSTWLLGKFFGLTLALILIALLFLLGWQGIYWGYGMGFMPVQDLTIFSVLSLSWVVMGAASIMFASFTGPAVALFCSSWLFLAGLLSGPIAQALAPDTPSTTKKFVETIAGLWNLHYFNLSTILEKNRFVDDFVFMPRVGYGLTLIVLFIATACLLFQNRDLVG